MSIHAAGDIVAGRRQANEPAGAGPKAMKEVYDKTILQSLIDDERTAAQASSVLVYAV